MSAGLSNAPLRIGTRTLSDRPVLEKSMQHSIVRECRIGLRTGIPCCRRIACQRQKTIVSMATPAPSTTPKSRILIVDDEKGICDILQMSLQLAGFECLTAYNGDDAVRILETESLAAVITDIRMPGVDGVELVKIAREKHQVDSIVMTAYMKEYTYERIIENGASDFVFKPITPNELIVRLRRVLRERALLADRNRKNLELHAALYELREAYHDTINRLVLAAEYKDENTGDHVMRIGRISALLAEKSGLSRSQVESIFFAAPMHDVGKIGIPDHILLKPGKLTEDEFAVMQQHTTIGGAILANPKAEILRHAREIALTHHERWDGKGYPHGLAGEAIPIGGRIVKLVDVFDALTSVRPYKDPYPVEVAIELIRKDSGTHFDPKLVELFLGLKDEIAEIKKRTCGKQGAPAEFRLSERDQGGNLADMMKSIAAKATLVDAEKKAAAVPAPPV